MRGLCVVCWLCSEDLMGLFCELGERGTTMETRKRTGAYYYYVVTEILYWVLIMIMLN